MRILCLLVVPVLASCASLEPREPAWPAKLEAGAGSLGALSEAACTEQNGIWSGAPGAEIAVCVPRVTDGGRECSDHSQCESLCVTNQDYRPRSKAKGVCADDFDTSGCIQGVSKGRAENILCSCDA